MFGNRAYGLKLAAAAALVALLGVWSHQRATDINPSVERCVLHPERYDGTRLWIPSGTIESSRPGGFVLGVDGLSIPVSGEAPAPAGAPVRLTGTFRAAGPRIELDEARAIPPRGRFRRLAVAVSALVLLAVLANFARHFAFRPKVLRAEAGR